MKYHSILIQFLHVNNFIMLQYNLITIIKDDFSLSYKNNYISPINDMSYFDCEVYSE